MSAWQAAGSTFGAGTLNVLRDLGSQCLERCGGISYFTGSLGLRLGIAGLLSRCGALCDPGFQASIGDVPGAAVLSALGVYGRIGAIGAKGVSADARFAQRTFGSRFSLEGDFKGQSVDDVVAALRTGALNPGDVAVNYIVRDGQTIILNTRTAAALESAGIPRSSWTGVDRTGDSLFEELLDGQLRRNPGGPFETVRRSGGR